jgi:Gas vesicle protein G
MFLLDSLLVNGLRFVLDKVALAAESEGDEATALQEALLQGQLRLETGEISEREYADIERGVLRRLGELRRRSGAPDGAAAYRVTGADVQVIDGENE